MGEMYSVRYVLDGGRMDVSQVQNLWFDGDAWCKAALLDERGDADGRPFERRFHTATQAFRSSGTEEDALRLLTLLVDDLLCEQLPDSSYFAEYERGPWERCSWAEARVSAEKLQGRLGDEKSEAALAWMEGVQGGHVFRYVSDHIVAVCRITPQLGVFFLDRG